MDLRLHDLDMRLKTLEGREKSRTSCSEVLAKLVAVWIVAAAIVIGISWAKHTHGRIDALEAAQKTEAPPR